MKSWNILHAETIRSIILVFVSISLVSCDLFGEKLLTIADGIQEE